MTPQEEEARRINERFYFTLPNNGSFTGINNINDRWKEANKCALIVVDEILKEFDHIPFNDDEYGTYKMKYWQEVKQEIEKL